MKKVILISIIFSFSLSANEEQSKIINILNRESLIKEYQEMFKQISKKRVGLDESEIVKVEEPFLTLENKKSNKNKSGTKIAIKKDNSLTLEAIFNKKAKINGKWYSLYQSVGDKKIISVSDNYVWLKTAAGKEKLTIRKKNENISIK